MQIYYRQIDKISRVSSWLRLWEISISNSETTLFLYPSCGRVCIRAFTFKPGDRMAVKLLSLALPIRKEVQCHLNPPDLYKICKNL